MKKRHLKNNRNISRKGRNISRKGRKRKKTRKCIRGGGNNEQMIQELKTALDPINMIKIEEVINNIETKGLLGNNMPSEEPKLLVKKKLLVNMIPYIPPPITRMNVMTTWNAVIKLTDLELLKECKKLNGIFSLVELKQAGFSAVELKQAGFSAVDLKQAGFSAGDLNKAGFSAEDLINAGFSAEHLINAGFSNGAIEAEKKHREEKLSAVKLKQAGFSAEDLKQVGFSAFDLKVADFSLVDLINAGFSAGDLINAGFSEGAVTAAHINNNTDYDSDKFENET